ncbi:MAG TPA: squalene/phytoene synthase family protein, partial [Polyangia bacterium]|nr:squalene/phytoene synthase family protein [Polyangia bacterium]
MSAIDDLLQKTSRTFALAIPLLPEPTRNQVGIAYLLFRIADSFEDGTLWPRDRRLAALDRFSELLARDPDEAQALAAECLRDPPIAHAGYRELLARMPLVLRDLAGLPEAARAIVVWQVRRSVEGMKGFVRRADARDRLTLTTMDELRDYCYSVAGIVGEMLTELYLLDRIELAAPAEELRNRAAAFGEGL